MSSEKPRIGLVGPTPPPNGGMALQALQLIGLLREEGFSVTPLSTTPPWKPAFIGRIPILRAIVRLVIYIFSLWNLAGKVNIVHVMANSGWSWQLHAAPALWLCWLRDTPVVVNYHGGAARDYFNKSFPRVKPSMEKAAMIVVPSGYLESVFADFGLKTTVIPNVVDRDLFKPATQCVGDTSVFTLVITRNLEQIYGIHTALEALAIVREQAPNVCLKIAGSGPQEAELRAMTKRLGLEGAVGFVGRLDRQGIVELYDSADAMLNPTTVDNMPTSVIEAMASGLPVISTDVGGIPYIVTNRESALLVPAGQPDSMAKAVLELKSDLSLQRGLRKNALEEVKKYTWPRVREQWLAAYHEVFSPALEEV